MFAGLPLPHPLPALCIHTPLPHTKTKHLGLPSPSPDKDGRNTSPFLSSIQSWESPALAWTQQTRSTCLRLSDSPPISAARSLPIPEPDGVRSGWRQEKAVAQRYLVAPPGHVQSTWHWPLTEGEGTGFSPPWEECQGIQQRREIP